MESRRQNEMVFITVWKRYNVLKKKAARTVRGGGGGGISNENEIKFIHCLPYRPHSQGVVERFHRLIKRGLNSYKLKLKKSYNIDYTIVELIK
jgi:hypothetical protein